MEVTQQDYDDMMKELGGDNISLTYHPKSHKYEYSSSTFYGFIDADAFQQAMQEAVYGKEKD